MDTVRAATSRAGASTRPIVNMHMHVPPNFSAFRTPEEVVAVAAREGARVVGASNFHDHRVYRRFADAARDAGILPMFGLEFITVLDELRTAGTLVNDPANPGRMYLCGKGVNPFKDPSPAALEIDAAARAANVERAQAMVALVRERFAGGGVATSLDDATIIEDVADRAGVPADWIVLQERHIAMAFQEVLFLLVPAERRAGRLARVFGAPTTVNIDDPIAVQGEIRSRLMKVGGPAFVAESTLSFGDAVRLVLEWDGIPAYPTLADGASPICAFEDPPEALAQRMLDLGLSMAELIPARNSPDVVDRYVRAFRSAGIVVAAGTEHNTLDQIPFDPACRGGTPLSAYARDSFLEGASVIVAHHHERSMGRSGFVEPDGKPGGGDREARIHHFAALGSAIIDSGVLIP